VEKKICNALQCKCLERSRKTIFRVAVWRFVIWQRAAPRGKEEGARLLRQVQKVRKAIKAMIVRNPSAKARKFVVDR
jgi:hypothetical protein